MGGCVIAEFTTPAGIHGTIREWEPGDLNGFIEMLKDPEVMEFLLTHDSDEERRDLFDKILQKNASQGWGIWAVEIQGEFAGWVGLNKPDFDAPFTPCVEIGWRFCKKFWGKSIAFSAAQCALEYGFEKLQLPEIVAFTVEGNMRSKRLMERLGFRYDAQDDFNHPNLPGNHLLLRHVLYRKQNPAS